MLPPLFAVSAILLDTHNFRKDFYNNKWNDLDKTVFNIIMSHAQSKVDPDRYYKEMNGAKKDLEKNLAQGILALYEKDKKTFEWGKNLCVWSSLPISFNKVVEKFGIEEVYKYFEEYKGKAKYYITSSFVENGNKVFYVFDQDHFKGDNRDDLKHQLTEVLKDHFTTINIMDDLADMFVFELDSTSSRKAVEPYIKKVFNKE
jgi:inorganic pyrophosphatase/exopolyphosphatase